MGNKLKDLERYTLRYPTILKMAKHFGKSFEEMQSILFEQNVIPGQMNTEQYHKLKSKSIECLANYYKVSCSSIYKAAASQHLNKPLYNISKRDLIRKVNCGMSASDLSKHYGVSYDKMLKFLKDNKVIAKKKRAKVSTEKVLTLYEQDLTVQEIARKLGCTVANVRYHLNKES